VDPAELTQALGLDPLHAWAAGSAREAIGAAPNRRHAESYWFAELPSPRTVTRELAHFMAPWVMPSASADAAVSSTRAIEVPIEGFLASQLRRLQSNAALLGWLREGGGSCELCVTLAARGAALFELSPSLLSAIAALHLSLSIEVAEDSGS
jgi:hypothetical protein